MYMRIDDESHDTGKNVDVLKFKFKRKVSDYSTINTKGNTQSINTL